MLIIRQTQMKAFEDAAFRTFENEMVQHLKTTFPRHAKILTDDDFRKTIRLGWERAQGHRVTAARHVRGYIELMCLLGSGFDIDPQVPWAAQILDDPAEPDEAKRARRLNQRVWEHLEHVNADFQKMQDPAAQARLREELRKMRHEPDTAPAPTTLLDFTQRLAARLYALFPARCAYLGDSCIRQVIQHGMQSAKGHGIASERGIVVFVALGFVLGAGFPTDPLLPWVSAILTDKTLTEQNPKVDQLYDGALDCLKRWLA
jgi:hypothetical protein